LEVVEAVPLVMEVLAAVVVVMRDAEL